MPQQILGTVLLRPYVIVFLIAFAAIATVQMGWRRMVVFALIGYLFGFGSEVLSMVYINLTPCIPLSFEGEGEVVVKRGYAPLWLPSILLRYRESPL